MSKMRLPLVSVGRRQISSESQCGIGAIFGICLQAATDVVCDDSSVEAGLVCPSQLIDLNAFVGAQPLMSPGQSLSIPRCALPLHICVHC
jgi:hypothetical protein